MWFTYCGASSDRVALDTFLLAVASYLHERLSMPDHAVDGVLTSENREALTLAVDADSNGKVVFPSRCLIPRVARDQYHDDTHSGLQSSGQAPTCQCVALVLPRNCTRSDSNVDTRCGTGVGVGGERCAGRSRCALPFPTAGRVPCRPQRRSSPFATAAGSQAVEPHSTGGKGHCLVGSVTKIMISLDVSLHWQRPGERPSVKIEGGNNDAELTRYSVSLGQYHCYEICAQFALAGVVARGGVALLCQATCH